MNEHAESIFAVKNLELEDCSCRFLEKFLPIWNCLLEGFGNHEPGKGRKNMMTPAWDWYHPGRAWAENLKPRSESPAQIDKAIRAYLENFLVTGCNFGVQCPKTLQGVIL